MPGSNIYHDILGIHTFYTSSNFYTHSSDKALSLSGESLGTLTIGITVGQPKWWAFVGAHPYLSIVFSTPP